MTEEQCENSMIFSRWNNSSLAEKLRMSSFYFLASNPYYVLQSRTDNVGLHADIQPFSKLGSHRSSRGILICTGEEGYGQPLCKATPFVTVISWSFTCSQATAMTACDFDATYFVSLLALQSLCYAMYASLSRFVRYIYLYILALYTRRAQ